MPTVASIQMQAGRADKAQAVERVVALLREARGSDLVLLPELWPTGYFNFERYEADSEPIDGPLVTTLRQQARELRMHVFTGSFIERDGASLYNTSLLLGLGGEILASYRKIHLFGYESQEQRLLSPGREVAVAPTPWGAVGLSTCYDLRFPELYRQMIDRKAVCFLVAAAWPQGRAEAWMLFNRARAHENLAWLLSCNFAGQDGQHTLAGHSLFVSPGGEVVADGGPQPGVVTREVDFNEAVTLREAFPALADRMMRDPHR